MSKTVVINNSTHTGVEKIRLSTPSGGSENWVPEDDRTLGTLTVTDNGTYDVSDTSVYGWDAVNVTVTEGDFVTGKGEDGKSYKVTVDGSGNIVETEIPAKIKVTTLPNTVTYAKGDTINYTGIVVTLYGGDGEVFTNTDFPTGTLSKSALVLPMKTATQRKIPVYWINAYTTEVLETSFNISWET